MKTKGTKHTIQLDVWTTNEECAADYVIGLMGLSRAIFGDDWEMLFDGVSTAEVRAALARTEVVDTFVEGESWREVKAG
jgi:hypothetical protein